MSTFMAHARLSNNAKRSFDRAGSQTKPGKRAKEQTTDYWRLTADASETCSTSGARHKLPVRVFARHDENLHVVLSRVER